MKRITLGLVVALIVLWGQSALAQDSLSTANQLIRDGSFDQAIQLLLPEYASNPAAKTAYALGQCYDGINDQSRTIQFFENALRLKGLTKKQKKHARRRIKIINKKLKTPTSNATLSVISNAPNALVRLDGVEIGRIPLSGLMIKPGRHTVVVELPGSKSWKKTFTAKAHTHVRLTARLKDSPSDVWIHTVPADARATIQGYPMCVTPCLLTLAAGNYKITIEREGYVPMTQGFTKPGDQPLELSYALLADNSQAIHPPAHIGNENSGHVALAVNVGGAKISVDGRPAGVSPLSKPVGLTAGIHQIAVSAPGFKPYFTNVMVVSGQQQQLNVVLKARLSGTFGPISDTVEPDGPTLAPANLNPLALETTTGADNSSAWTWMISGGSVMLVGAGLTTGALILKYKFDMVELLKVNNNNPPLILKSGISRKDALQWEQNAQIMMYTSYALYGLGAGALIVGWLLYESDDDFDPLTAPGFSVYPVLDSNLVGAAATVRF
ncbi:MAG TPA: PEGA domain-containing protein [Myxococcales bacterium]|nr:PEGA domain-containing protein [Myxococcales bacterium]